MSIVKNTLDQRGGLYGKYSDGLKFRSACLQLMATNANPKHPELRSEYAISFTDIIGKVSRLLIVQGHKDSWVDLAGYAYLNRNMFSKSHVVSNWVNKEQAFFVDAFIMIAMESFVRVNGLKAKPTETHKNHIRRLAHRLYFISKYPESFKAWNDLASFAEKEASKL